MNNVEYIYWSFISTISLVIHIIISLLLKIPELTIFYIGILILNSAFMIMLGMVFIVECGYFPTFYVFLSGILLISYYRKNNVNNSILGLLITSITTPFIINEYIK